MSDLIGSAFNGLRDTATGLVNKSQSVVDRILAPEQRATFTANLSRFARERPGLASFILSHIALSGLPIAIFIAFTVTVAIFTLLVAIIVALVGAVLFIVLTAGFALAILFPILLFTTFVAVSVWLWCWGAYHLLKWFNDGDIPSINTNFVAGISKEAKGWWDRPQTSGPKKLKQKGPAQNAQQETGKGPAQTNGDGSTHSSTTSHEKLDTSNDTNKETRRHPGHQVPGGSRETGSQDSKTTCDTPSSSSNRTSDAAQQATRQVDSTDGTS